MDRKKVAIYARVSTRTKTLKCNFRTYGGMRKSMDLKSSAGEAMFTIISAIAKFERDMISERVKGGLRKTKEKGNRHGDALFLCDKKEVMQQDLLRL